MCERRGHAGHGTRTAAPYGTGTEYTWPASGIGNGVPGGCMYVGGGNREGGPCGPDDEDMATPTEAS